MAAGIRGVPVGKRSSPGPPTPANMMERTLVFGFEIQFTSKSIHLKKNIMQIVFIPMPAGIRGIPVGTRSSPGPPRLHVL